MIHELSGDLLFSGAKVIVQGVAPNDDFHHGLALQLRERMPVMYKDFRHYCQTRHPKSGGLWAWMSPDGHHIVNLFTMDAVYNHGSKPGHATLSHVNHALHALRVFIQKEQVGNITPPCLLHDGPGLVRGKTADRTSSGRSSHPGVCLFNLPKRRNGLRTNLRGNIRCRNSITSA